MEEPNSLLHFLTKIFSTSKAWRNLKLRRGLSQIFLPLLAYFPWSSGLPRIHSESLKIFKLELENKRTFPMWTHVFSSRWKVGHVEFEVLVAFSRGRRGRRRAALHVVQVRSSVLQSSIVRQTLHNGIQQKTKTDIVQSGKLPPWDFFGIFLQSSD